MQTNDFFIFKLDEKYIDFIFAGLLLLSCGTGQLTSLIFILSYETWFYEPTILEVHTPICKIATHATIQGCLENFIRGH